MPLRAEGRTAPALLIGALTLCVGVQFALPVSAPPNLMVGVHGRGGERVRSAPAPAQVQAYAAILLHPLFNANRSSEAAGPAGEVAAVGAMALLGVASAGPRASAILRDPAGLIRTLALGESLDGWRLAGVGRDGAVLARGGKTQVLRVGAPATVTPTPQAVGR